MTALLITGGVVVLALLALGIWLMERAGAEPAARGSGTAPDPHEESRAREALDADWAERSPGVLTDRHGD